jgi:hypothetical protein
MYDLYYQNKKDAAHKLYTERPVIYSPVQRFELLPLALYILETTTKPPAYRRCLCTMASRTSPSKKTELVQWWSFVHFFKNEHIEVRVVVRKVGKGKLHFWSVMLNTTGMAEAPNLANLAAMWE